MGGGRLAFKWRLGKWQGGASVAVRIHAVKHKENKDRTGEGKGFGERRGIEAPASDKKPAKAVLVPSSGPLSE